MKTKKIAKAVPFPELCPRCGDAVKWSRGMEAEENLGAAQVEGIVAYRFSLSCSKMESRSLRGLHGSCHWGFTAIGYFDENGKPYLLKQKVRWHYRPMLARCPAKLLGNRRNPKAENDKTKAKLALVLLPQEVDDLHNLFLAMENLTPQKQYDMLGKNVATLPYLFALVRAAVCPAGAEIPLSLRLKEPDKG